MALDKAALKTKVIGIMTDMLTKEENSIEEFATRLTDAIDLYIKQATVTVNTTGTAAAQTGFGVIS